MAKQLAERVKKVGVKQGQIAKKSKVTPASVSLVLRGKSTSARIVDIAEELIKKAESNKQ